MSATSIFIALVFLNIACPDDAREYSRNCFCSVGFLPQECLQRQREYKNVDFILQQKFGTLRLLGTAYPR